MLDAHKDYYYGALLIAVVFLVMVVIYIKFGKVGSGVSATMNSEVVLTVEKSNYGLLHVTDPDGIVIPAKEYDGILAKIGTYIFTDVNGNEKTLDVILYEYDAPTVQKGAKK